MQDGRTDTIEAPRCLLSKSVKGAFTSFKVLKIRQKSHVLRTREKSRCQETTRLPLGLLLLRHQFFLVVTSTTNPSTIRNLQR